MASTFPRTIHLLWLQGWSHAPALARLNRDCWSRLNPEYRVVLHDRASVQERLAGTSIPIDTLTPQALSDVFRLALLSECRGVWADASVLPVQQLDAWLSDRLDQSAFFCFARPGPDRLIASWFLAVRDDDGLVPLLWKACQQYWFKPRRLRQGFAKPSTPSEAAALVDPRRGACEDTFPYFWMHYLFNLLVQESEEFRESFLRSATLPAGPAHAVQAYLAAACRDQVTFSELQRLGQTSPLQKLDWRRRYPLHWLKRLSGTSAG